MKTLALETHVFSQHPVKILCKKLAAFLIIDHFLNIVFYTEVYGDSCRWGRYNMNFQAEKAYCSKTQFFDWNISHRM